MQWISELQDFTKSWDLKPAYVRERLCIYQEGIEIQKQAISNYDREMQQIMASCGTVVENNGKAMHIRLVGWKQFGCITEMTTSLLCQLTTVHCDHDITT